MFPGAMTRAVRGYRTPKRLRFLGREWRWWVAILLMYAVSRVVTTLLLLTVYLLAVSFGWQFGSARPNQTFFTFLGSWDGAFYRVIAEHGYPSQLPIRADGSVQPNPWAFMPVYAWVVRGLMTVTGLPFDPAGVLVATICGAGAALVLYRLVCAYAGGTAGWWAAVLFVFGPLSFVLQIAYAESLFFLLMFAALWAMIVRNYWAVLPITVIAGFTRPGAAVIPLALAIVLIVRFARSKRMGPDAEPLQIQEALAIVVTGMITATTSLSWPFIVSGVTGIPDAYLRTELAWWTSFIGPAEFRPFTPWFLLGGTYLGILGIALVIVTLACFCWLLARKSVRALGVETVAFVGSHALYLFAVFLPQQSIFRLLMPIAPLYGAPALTENRRARQAVLIAGLVLQPVTIVFLWFIGFP